MRFEDLVTPQDWARAYRSLFGLPRVHATAPGFVVLPLADSIGLVDTPEPLGALILGELTIRGIPGPVLVRETPPRRTFLALPDHPPDPETRLRLHNQGIHIPSPTESLVLPTGFGRHTHENRWWARAPQRDEPLPLLSEIIAATTAVLSREC
ncbi:hypothetical protein IU500_23935 [Nocardia terpenica]|uniref:hypothetical protein n=1 Tax=Nocardia terpenica TaxID=455432 RepID=UPI001893C9B1|nr:hypothetical protein [Nocardia terpenica]MBF6063719.1 hypothetical protein [Nocardia terpenica]MBF6107095.1 hypothetical protein [Nocardia terpenica]MBF6114268.1 hypothetical protein [Nocardia terpenica]MBF6121645.1 hypothetical protein [Nocardia terpenica]MBF6154060.1 hypothetical protein [Nocardia terpenica]